jgi:hypothetical protein
MHRYLGRIALSAKQTFRTIVAARYAVILQPGNKVARKKRRPTKDAAE